MKIRTIRIYAFLLTINNTIYSGSKQFWNPGSNKLFKGVLRCYLVVGDLFYYKMLSRCLKIGCQSAKVLVSNQGDLQFHK